MPTKKEINKIQNAISWLTPFSVNMNLTLDHVEAVLTLLELAEQVRDGRLKTYKEWTMLEEGDDCVMFCSEVNEHKEKAAHFEMELFCLREKVRKGELVEPASKEEIENIITQSGFSHILAMAISPVLLGHIAKPTPLVTAKQIKKIDNSMSMLHEYFCIKSLDLKEPECNLIRAYNNVLEFVDKTLADCREAILKGEIK